MLLSLLIALSLSHLSAWPLFRVRVQGTAPCPTCFYSTWLMHGAEVVHEEMQHSHSPSSDISYSSEASQYMGKIRIN